jgi:pilus assembly protein Flp/PilA
MGTNFKGEPHMTRLLTSTKNFVKKYITRKEEGATLAEYGLLLALIAVICIGAIAALGTQIKAMFNALAGSI